MPGNQQVEDIRQVLNPAEFTLRDERGVKTWNLYQSLSTSPSIGFFCYFFNVFKRFRRTVDI